jgi:RNA polymerase sigma-70 factor (ECF subfamily)
LEIPTNQQIAAWYPRLFRSALRLCGNVHDSADLTQQAFCRALATWSQYDGRCQPVTWLHGILINCVRDWARWHAVRGTTVDFDEWSVAAVAPGGSPAERLGMDEDLARLRSAITALPDDLRRPFVAAVMDGHPYQVVAEMLATPVGTVAYRVHLARRALSDTLRLDAREEGS